MLQRPIGWVARNKLIAGGLAVVLVGVIAAVAIVAGHGSKTSSNLAGPGGISSGTEHAGPSTGPSASGGAAAPGRGVSAGDSSPVTGGGGISQIPGLGGAPKGASCRAAPVKAPGVTTTSITVGQIVTDNNQIPQQLGPAHDGLNAFIKLFNTAGGLCGRTLKLDYRNDNLNPATHRSDAQELADSTFAFVGNESLLDFLDYDQNPPFSPQVQGGGGFVPDVGGLAFAYNRSQSAWHAGVIGSVSPVLIGGGQFRGYIQEAKAKGTPCRKAAVVYLEEPTGASQDEATLFQAALEASWGGDLGSGNTKLYSANLVDPEPAYETLVDRMVADGMNCVFTATDVNSNVNLAQAMNNRGVWPPSKCKLGAACFRIFWLPFSAYDSTFVRNGGDGALGVSTFIPHLPFSEPDAPPMKVYLAAIRALGTKPSTFSVLGFASGVMLVQALESCPAAPTRTCVMTALRRMQDFDAGGLLGATTPFKTTRATYSRYGTFDWKWIFYRSISMRVEDRNGKRDFYRISPSSGFFTDTLHVARSG
jgi:ABC-type branched-subunit amino acid transport system substrate-binding protein